MYNNLCMKERFRWTDEAKAFLKSNWGQMSPYKIALSLGCDQSTVLYHAKKDNFEEHKKRAFWTPQEDEKIKELHSAGLSLEEISGEVEHTAVAVDARLLKLGVDRDWTWNETEIEILRELAPTHTAEEISNIIGTRSEKSVFYKANNLNIRLARHGQNWKDFEIEFLKDHWGYKSAKYIADRVFRPVESVTHMAAQLNLGKAVDRNFNVVSVQDICKLFYVEFHMVVDTWTKKGLVVEKRKISNNRVVKQENLRTFLENNLDVWSANTLPVGALGIEEDWLKEKRKEDKKGFFKQTEKD